METLIPVLLGLLTPIILVYLFFKKRRSRLTEDGPIVGTDADREAAERELAEMPSNIRVQLATTKDVVERFSTRHGFTETYVEVLATSLRDQGIECDVVFQPGAMPGVADSLLQQHGEYELWVEKNQMRKAAELLKTHRN